MVDEGSQMAYIKQLKQRKCKNRGRKSDTCFNNLPKLF